MNINATSSFSNIQQINKDYSAEQPVEVKQDNSSPQATGDKVSLGGADKEVGVHKKWTVLHYGAGDNDVGDYIKQGVQRMERVGSSDSAHVVSMLDLPKQNCVTYYVTKNHHFGINSPVVKENGSHVNMADPDTLAQFIAWGIKKLSLIHI